MYSPALQHWTYTGTIHVPYWGGLAVREPAFAVMRFEVLTIVKTLLKPAVLKERNRIAFYYRVMHSVVRTIKLQDKTFVRNNW
jgi:hypothetical protein